MENIMATLNIKFMADRAQLAELSGIALEVLDEYRPVLAELSSVDDGHEPCAECAVEGQLVAVNWYGRTSGSEEAVSGACCRACLPLALYHADVDPYGRVELEYLPLVPKAGA